MMDTAELISDAELQSLPEDPQQAFAEFERITRGRMQDTTARLNENEYEPAQVAQEIRLSYYTAVAAAGAHYEVSGLDDLQGMDFSNFNYNDYRNFLLKVSAIVTRIRLRRAEGVKTDTVAIDPPTLIHLRARLSELRDCLDKSDLEDKKKDSLRKKLSDFEAALAAGRVSLSTVMKVVAAFAVFMHGGSGLLEDARKSVDSITVLVGKAAASEEEARRLLGAPEPQKRIAAQPDPAPTKPSSKSLVENFDLDDEIPF